MAYPGGKAGPGTYQRIINHMPPHRVYIEPFLGFGAVLRAKRPAEENIGIEIDPEVIAAHWSDRSRSATTGDGGEGLGDPRGRTARHDDEDLGSRAAAAATENVDGGFASTTTEGGAEALTVLHGDGLAYLRDRDWRGDELVYCDPPYMPGSRTSGPLYRWDMTEAQHEALLAITHHLRERGVLVMISGYHSKLYARELRGWTLTTFGSMTRRGMALEHLWMSFPDPVELHDYRFLGEDYRQRERIRKKVGRWKAKLEGMPKLERQALMAAMAEVDLKAEAA